MKLTRNQTYDLSWKLLLSIGVLLFFLKGLIFYFNAGILNLLGEDSVVIVSGVLSLIMIICFTGGIIDLIINLIKRFKKHKTK